MHDRRERTMDGLTMAGSPSPQRVRWGAVFAGVVLGLALLALLTTLWFALAYNSGVDVVRDNLEWFIGGTAVAALFIGGLLAGWLSGVRGPGSGFFNGITMWGLILIVAVAVGLPAVFNILNLGPVASIDEGGLIGTGVDDTLWATFFTILGGFLASGLGGLIGGAVTMPANAHLQRTDIVDEDHDHVDVRDHDDDHDHDHDHDHDDDEDERETVTTRRAS